MNARPVLDETDHQAQTTSIATAPVAASCVITNAGYISRLTAAAGGTTTGTISVSVSVNGGSDITGGNLTVAAGTGARNGGVLELPVAIGTCYFVNEGDQVSFVASGGTGASIPGAFGLVVRNT
jgi:hypothetical protein